MGTEQDFYDIIIENVTKEWYISMNNNLQRVKWEIPKYSKKQIDRASKVIANPASTNPEEKDALEILNNWRSSHAYPLQVITTNLRHKNPNAIVVQRLKRLDSIIGKLKRFPDMSLYRMQDLGGCRVIVESLEDVYASLNQYKSSRIRHILKRENDYIQDPKESGYRSYHIVYQFHSDSRDTYNKNMYIEIQFRTRLQHIWATALETMGVYTKTALKASIGDKDILRFFVLVSSIFAKMENTPVCPNTPDDYNQIISEIKEIDKRTNIVSKINGISTAAHITNQYLQYEKSKYYILMLDYSKNSVVIHSYKASEIELATIAYNHLELFNTSDIDSVLVSAASFDALKAAYPNYFSDITDFVSMLRRILA